MAKQFKLLLRSIIVFALFAIILITAISSRLFWQVIYPLPFKTHIFNYAQEFDIDPYLVAAIIRSESKFIPIAKSEKGAIGLMQLMPETAAWGAATLSLEQPTEEELYHVELNIRLGSWFLKQLLKEFDNRLTLVLAAYNAGSGRVREWLEAGIWDGSETYLEDIPFKETRLYVEAVLRSYTVYKQLYIR